MVLKRKSESVGLRAGAFLVQKGVSTMTAADRVIATAEAELGYLEKKSNQNLDSKTANAGSNNYTKFNRDMRAWAGSAGLNDQWCQNFVDWVFVKTFGLEVAKKLIYTFTNYTPSGSNAFKKKGRYIKRGSGKPKRGDVIYFYSTAKGRIGHVGIVYKVSGSTVYTIEGNTSGASTLVTNGGGVKKKSYSMSSTYIDGYGSVDYSAAGDAAPEPAVLSYGSVGSEVTAMQKLLLRWNAKCLPRYGADGDFGSETLAALKAFQKTAGVSVTGKYDKATRSALASAVGQYVEITGSSVNIRKGPGTKYDVIGVLHKGDRLPYGGKTFENGWLLVEYGNQNAAVSGKYGRLVS